MHELEEHGRVDVQSPSPAEARLHAQMQHHEAHVGQPHEHRDTQRPPGFGYREQRLYTFDVAHPDAQAPVLLVNLRNPVGRYGLLDPDAHPMLIRVEKEQLLERGTLLHGQL